MNDLIAEIESKIIFLNGDYGYDSDVTSCTNDWIHCGNGQRLTYTELVEFNERIDGILRYFGSMEGYYR